jgi:hypothetical protein
MRSHHIRASLGASSLLLLLATAAVFPIPAYAATYYIDGKGYTLPTCIGNGNYCDYFNVTFYPPAHVGDQGTVVITPDPSNLDNFEWAESFSVSLATLSDGNHYTTAAGSCTATYVGPVYIGHITATESGSFYLVITPTVVTGDGVHVYVRNNPSGANIAP